jgi:hypothetical protein
MSMKNSNDIIAFRLVAQSLNQLRYLRGLIQIHYRKKSILDINNQQLIWSTAAHEHKFISSRALR